MSIVRILRSSVSGHVPAVAVAATGNITFSVNPSNNDTITLGGTVITFVSGGATGNQILIQSSLSSTLASLLTFLQGSNDVKITDCTYAVTSNALNITYNTMSSDGNSFAIAASAATPSGATLSGGIDGVQTGRVAINEADGIFFWLDADGETVRSYNFRNPVAPTQAPGDSSLHAATTAFVASAIAAVLGSPPDTLNTLQKIAAAINNDAAAYNDLYTMITNGTANGLNYTPQSLTQAQQQQVYTNLGLTAVLNYTAQSLTPAQQQQVYANLGLTPTEQVLTFGATVNWDMSKSLNALLTLTGNATIAAPANAIPGFSYVLRLLQDSTGSRTVAWSNCFDWGLVGPPTLTTTASKFDVISMYCVSTNLFACVALKGF